jgi:hypothetical protein
MFRPMTAFLRTIQLQRNMFIYINTFHTTIKTIQSNLVFDNVVTKHAYK